jgi:hypothetical protein
VAFLEEVKEFDVVAQRADETFRLLTPVFDREPSGMLL